MIHSKIGFHSGPTGNLTGISNFWQALNDAEIPIFHKCTDTYGPLYQISQLSNIHIHHLVYRITTHGQNDDYDYDVPDYNKLPHVAALEHWQQTKSKLPPEFNKDLVWIEVINEVDKNRSEWLGLFGESIANLALADGYKVLLPAWSSGEPEPEHWQGLRPFLEICATNPEEVALSVHEYDFGIEGYDAVYPYHYGRFQWCFDYCDRNNIARPNIFITEWGWAKNDVPLWNDALDTINKCNTLYCKYPQIKGAALWNLDGGWGTLNNQLLQYMQPLTQYTLNNTFYEGGIDEPLDPDYFENQPIDNYLLNHSFENGWRHVNNIQEIQIPNSWDIWFTDVTGTYKTFSINLERIGDYIPNPHDSAPWSEFVRYEMRILPRNQLPQHEQDLFILDGDYTNKTFKGFGAWFGGLFQSLSLEQGLYKLTVKVFADLVASYSNGEKVWATDPLSGLVRFNNGDFESLTAGEWNILEYEFEGNGLTDLNIDFMLPFALHNSGLFMDDWKLERIESGCDCSAITDVKTVSIWIPQYNQLTSDELNQAVGWAINGFELPDGTQTDGNHMLCPSHVDALRIVTQGNEGSILAVAYPSKIGTGVTMEWLEQNCNAVFCDNKQVVFLGENDFKFDNVPVIYR